jgi:hypothetical protein
MPLFAITGPDDVEVTIVAPTPMMALRLFHAEAFGSDRSVRLIDDQLVFRRRADQELCAGTWVVTRQAVNGTAVSTVTIEIPEPD